MSLVVPMNQGCPLMVNLVNMTFKHAQIIAINFVYALKQVCFVWSTGEQNQVEDSNSSLQYFLPMTCHEKIIFEIWQHSFRNRLYLLQRTYESKIKQRYRQYIFQISIISFFSVVRGIA